VGYDFMVREVVKFEKSGGISDDGKRRNNFKTPILLAQKA
jgi:hypothetical protein